MAYHHHCAALERWCAEHLNRWDITFREDPDGIPAYIEALMARGLDAEPGYETAEGVTVTDEVFDQLLQLNPDVAAALTEALRQLADDLGDPDDRTPRDRDES